MKNTDKKISDLTTNEFSTIITAFRRSSEYLKMLFTDIRYEEFVSKEIAEETEVLNLLCEMRYGMEGYGL